MGFFSRSKSSVAATTNTSNGQSGATSESGTATSVAVTGSSGNHVTLTDHDSVDRSFDFAELVTGETISTVLSLAEMNAELANNTMDITAENTQNTLNAVGGLANNLRSENSKLTDNITKYGLFTAAIIGSVYIWRVTA